MAWKKCLRIFFWFGSLSVWEFESLFLILFCWIWFDFESLFSFSLQPFKHKHCIFFSSLFRNGSVLFFFCLLFLFRVKKKVYFWREKKTWNLWIETLNESILFFFAIDDDDDNFFPSFVCVGGWVRLADW